MLLHAVDTYKKYILLKKKKILFYLGKSMFPVYETLITDGDAVNFSARWSSPAEGARGRCMGKIHFG